MPAKISRGDWDRLFRKNAPRRGGPFRVLANVVLFGTVLILVIGATIFGLRYGLERTRANDVATQVARATSNAEIYATGTARALAANVQATSTAPTTPTAPAAEVLIGTGSVASGGNLRSEPQVVPETVIGQVCAGDQIAFLEERTVDASLWYRIRVTQPAGNCAPDRVTAGSSGWASSTLLSAPTP